VQLVSCAPPGVCVRTRHLRHVFGGAPSRICRDHKLRNFASVGLLDFNEGWVTLFCQKHTNDASEWKQLDAHQQQSIFGVPCPDPPGATVLRSDRNYRLSRVGPVILPCFAMDPSVPLQSFASLKHMTSCVDEPCVRLFYALSAAIGFVVMDVDCTNAPSST
jgi:hypothetical protein